jgi:hypothetical protein
MILISKVQNIIIQKKKKKTHPYKITRISFFLKIFFFFLGPELFIFILFTIKDKEKHYNRLTLVYTSVLHNSIVR